MRHKARLEARNDRPIYESATLQRPPRLGTVCRPDVCDLAVCFAQRNSSHKTDPVIKRYFLVQDKLGV
jgi:hypothetical protein